MDTPNAGVEVAVGEIGPRIRERRKVLGLTLKQLGQLAEVDFSHLAKLERGAGTVSTGTLDRILFELGLSLRLVDRPRRRSLRNRSQNS